jgi:hypothetical protein
MHFLAHNLTQFFDMRGAAIRLRFGTSKPFSAPITA